MCTCVVLLRAGLTVMSRESRLAALKQGFACALNMIVNKNAIAILQKNLAMNLLPTLPTLNMLLSYVLTLKNALEYGLSC